MKKIDYKHGKFTILTSQVDTDEFDHEAFELWRKDMDMEPLGDDYDEAYFDWCAEETQANYEADMDNIEACKEYNVPVLITGHLGLWWGKPEIEPVREESVHNAIQKCLNGADTVTVEWEDGEIHVFAGHHDGCNCFTIRALSKKGIAKQYAEYKEHDFKRLPYLYAIGL